LKDIMVQSLLMGRPVLVRLSQWLVDQPVISKGELYQDQYLICLIR